MTALPAKNVLDGSTAPLTSAMKTAMGQLRDFLSETVGAVGGALTIAKTAVTSPVAGDGNVFSGTYTPTLTNATNISASTASVCQYLRVGGVVTVSGRVTFDPIATGTNTLLGLSLPVASNFGAAEDAGGTFSPSAGAQSTSGVIYGDSGNNRASFRVLVDTAANSDYYFSFTYRII